MKVFPHLWLFAALHFASILSAVEVRIATFNVFKGIEGASSLGRINAENVLARIDADIVGLQEVNAGDLNDGHLDDLANNLGYPYIFIPSTALDTGSRVVLLSKFPFVPTSTTSIVSPPGANDVTRAAAAAVIDVPGTVNDPTIITAHLKCCFEDDDPFRRAVEMMRIRGYLEDGQLDGNNNVFVMGDFNLLGTQDFTFEEIPPGLPATFELGDDITFDVEYFVNPTQYFTGLGLIDPGPRQQDGLTTDTFMGSTSVLDYLLVSTAVANRNPATEIYNSELETSFPGLPKAGSPLSFTASALASDHYPVYGDFNLDDGPSFGITSSVNTLDEGDPPATISITLNSPASVNLNITLQLDDPSEAALAQSLLTIPAGQSSASTTISPLFDQIPDGNQNIRVLASAPGFTGNNVTLVIRDADPQLYRLVSSTTPVVENFNNFAGGQNPAAWVDNGLTWRGEDDGSGSVQGARSYEGSLGILTTSPTSFQTALRNDSGAGIPALRIQYSGQHWRRSTNGSQDRIEASVIRNGTPTRLPLLDFFPSTAGPNGQLSPPDTLALSTYLRDLNFSPGEEFQLRFELLPGTPGGSGSNDVFINEFHYDNSGTDQDEFIEVFVGEDFEGEIDDILIQLYNGNGGTTYDQAQSLSTFAESRPNGPDGPLLFHKEISGIQNGGPDGIALIVDGTLREFISYEGTFTATNGPAVGVTSTSVGVSQSGGTPVGQNSIARSGTGGAAVDFTWGIQPGPHTPGSLNTGQSIGASPQPQGLAIDNLVITPLIDSDGDLLPDMEESDLGTDPFRRDSDQDGQDDFFEAFLAGTDPLSALSTFRPELTLPPGQLQVAFPTLAGRTYQIESSSNLNDWTPLPPQAGTGSAIITSIPRGDTLFVRVRISIP